MAPDGDKPMIKSVVEGVRTRTNFLAVTAGRIDRVGIPGLLHRRPTRRRNRSVDQFPGRHRARVDWDVDIERVSAAIGAEAPAPISGVVSASMSHPFPGWGYAQESYGEDPLLLGEMGAAATEGAKPWVITSVKHFALNWRRRLWSTSTCRGACSRKIPSTVS